MFFNRISFKITIWSAVAFFIGAIILFLFTRYLLHESLKSKDQDLLELKFQSYETLLENYNLKDINNKITNDKSQDTAQFLIRYQSPTGQTLFLHVPDSLELVAKKMSVKELDAHLMNEALHGPWLHISGAEYGDDLEVLSRKLASGGILQVGKDTEDRELFFEQYTRVFFLCLVPMLIIATVFGGFLAAKVLSPIRWLTQTVQKIYAGQIEARVLLSGNQDELDQLGGLFNQMLDRNQRLVQGMKDTLDSVAHDLKTPIMRLQNSAQSALHRTPQTEAESIYYQALGDCQENSEFIVEMLRTIMDISEAEAGMMFLDRQRIKVSSLFEKVIDLYGFVAEEKSICIETEIPIPEKSIAGDSVRLLQALSNLVDNAIKYSPANSVVTLRGISDLEFVQIEVIDQGPGIPDNEMTKIWSRLYRGDKSRSSRGLGLGLSLVQAIVTAHSGTAHVENNSSGGCTFRLIFPILP